jgi:hypothetical protein
MSSETEEGLGVFADLWDILRETWQKGEDSERLPQALLEVLVAAVGAKAKGEQLPEDLKASLNRLAEVMSLSED